MVSPQMICEQSRRADGRSNLGYLRHFKAPTENLDSMHFSSLNTPIITEESDLQIGKRDPAQGRSWMEPTSHRLGARTSLSSNTNAA